MKHIISPPLRSATVWPFMVLSALLMPASASAHAITGVVGGLASGFLHPLTGLDHVLAMVSVGIWGAFLGEPAIWVLPVVFPMVMAVGGAIGVVAGTPLHIVEVGIALSAIVLGWVVMMAARPKLWIAAVIVGVFALCHGYAHGVELPSAANAITYAMGFVVATGLLHIGGIALGLLTRWDFGRIVIRIAGGGVALVGLCFMFGFL